MAFICYKARIPRIGKLQISAGLFEKIGKLRLVREEYKKLSKYSAKPKIFSIN